MLNRRELLTAMLGSQIVTLAGCSQRALPAEGELLAPNFEVGHRIRDRNSWPKPALTKKVDVVVVGGGIAGLSAAWRLQDSGLEDFLVLEIDDTAGGTARSGTSGHFAYPWGAHYLPTPMAENEDLVQLLQEMQMLDQVLDDGTPIVKEQHLCRDPEERVFFQGSWHEGLYPFAGASDSDLEQLNDFRGEIDRWVSGRDQAGRRLFAIPIAARSDNAQVMNLDQLTMSMWMEQQGFHSPRLRWLVDYSCRDDYGLSIEQTSAWAGLFYFASRISKPGQDSQAVITWPEGNGRIVKHLAQTCGDRLQTGQAVIEISQEQDTVSLLVFDTGSLQVQRIECKHAIFAAPQFLVPHVIRGLDQARINTSAQFQYGSWMVANAHLKNRPADNGFPMSWDNVIHGSQSLGYVTSTHQSGIDHGPTVLTWYYPFTERNPKLTRQQLLTLDWSAWADLVLTDLAVPHPEIHGLVTRLDVMRWGHAMVQPRVGFVSSQALEDAAAPAGRIHFAGTDLSGIALLEEAFHHGVRAANEVLISVA
ncbi:MAG: flavin monoamine oxidase family protein [Rubripirellula sp.]